LYPQYYVDMSICAFSTSQPVASSINGRQNDLRTGTFLSRFRCRGYAEYRGLRRFQLPTFHLPFHSADANKSTRDSLYSRTGPSAVAKIHTSFVIVPESRVRCQELKLRPIDSAPVSCLSRFTAGICIKLDNKSALVFTTSDARNITTSRSQGTGVSPITPRAQSFPAGNLAFLSALRRAQPVSLSYSSVVNHIPCLSCRAIYTPCAWFAYLEIPYRTSRRFHRWVHQMWRI
jgi:hypothetical protein